MENINAYTDDNNTLHLSCERCDAQDEYLYEPAEDEDGEPDPFGADYDTEWLWRREAGVICPNCQTDIDRRIDMDLCPRCGLDDERHEPCEIIEDEFGTELEVCDDCYDAHYDRIERTQGRQAAVNAQVGLYAKWWYDAWLKRPDDTKGELEKNYGADWAGAIVLTMKQRRLESQA